MSTNVLHFLRVFLVSNTFSGLGIIGGVEANGLVISLWSLLDYTKMLPREKWGKDRASFAFATEMAAETFLLCSEERESSKAGGTLSPFLGFCEHVGLPTMVMFVQRNPRSHSNLAETVILCTCEGTCRLWIYNAPSTAVWNDKWFATETQYLA